MFCLLKNCKIKNPALSGVKTNYYENSLPYEQLLYFKSCAKL